ncbi:hypothetical protein ACVMAJ_000150 [Bradyrhizobium sp. USDA 4448]
MTFEARLSVDGQQMASVDGDDGSRVSCLLPRVFVGGPIKKLAKWRQFED